MERNVMTPDRVKKWRVLVGGEWIEQSWISVVRLSPDEWEREKVHVCRTCVSCLIPLCQSWYMRWFTEWLSIRKHIVRGVCHECVTWKLCMWPSFRSQCHGHVKKTSSKMIKLRWVVLLHIPIQLMYDFVHCISIWSMWIQNNVIISWDHRINNTILFILHTTSLCLPIWHWHITGVYIISPTD